MKGTNYKGHNVTWKLGRLMNFSSQNVVYMLECDLENCKRRYNGLASLRTSLGKEYISLSDMSGTKLNIEQQGKISLYQNTVHTT